MEENEQLHYPEWIEAIKEEEKINKHFYEFVKYNFFGKYIS